MKVTYKESELWKLRFTSVDLFGLVLVAEAMPKADIESEIEVQ